MDSKSPQKAKGKCGDTKEIMILGGAVYWECPHLSLMYWKKLVVFRLASSVPNYIDELIGEGRDIQDRGTGKKGE